MKIFGFMALQRLISHPRSRVRAFCPCFCGRSRQLVGYAISVWRERPLCFGGGGDDTSATFFGWSGDDTSATFFGWYGVDTSATFFGWSGDDTSATFFGWSGVDIADCSMVWNSVGWCIVFIVMLNTVKNLTHASAAQPNPINPVEKTAECMALQCAVREPDYGDHGSSTASMSC
jgi:hypothetical protein